MIQSNQLKKLKLKQIEKNKNCQYLTGYLNKVIRPFRKMSRYVRNFKNKDRNKEKNENDKLYLSVELMARFWKNIRPFTLKLKTIKMLNEMHYQFLMTAIQKLN